MLCVQVNRCSPVGGKKRKWIYHQKKIESCTRKRLLHACALRHTHKIITPPCFSSPLDPYQGDLAAAAEVDRDLFNASIVLSCGHRRVTGFRLCTISTGACCMSVHGADGSAGTGSLRAPLWTAPLKWDFSFLIGKVLLSPGSMQPSSGLNPGYERGLGSLMPWATHYTWGGIWMEEGREGGRRETFCSSVCKGGGGGGKRTTEKRATLSGTWMLL